MGIIDLLNNKYMDLRERREFYWREEGGIEISASEWYLLLQIYNGENIISELGRRNGNSRQATHKSLQSMERKGLIAIENIPGRRKEKMAVITSEGNKYCEEDHRIKERIEEELCQMIGKEKVDLLESLLNQPWN